MKESQNKSILAYLQTGKPITPEGAREMFSCWRLSARIKELRKQGYDITTNTMSSINKFGKKVNFASYSLNGR